MKKILLVLTVLLLTPLTVFAETKNQSMEVTATIESDYTVQIPKSIIIDSQTKTATYTVSLTGDLLGNQAVRVNADSTFVMRSAEGKADVTVTVEQTKNAWTYQNMTDATGTITAEGLTAGTWTGTLNFEIKSIEVINFTILEGGVSLYANLQAEKDMTWEQWVNSSYNLNGFELERQNGKRIVIYSKPGSNDYSLISTGYTESGAVSNTDIIVNNQEYMLIPD